MAGIMIWRKKREKKEGHKPLRQEYDKYGEKKEGHKPLQQEYDKYGGKRRSQASREVPADSRTRRVETHPTSELGPLRHGFSAHPSNMSPNVPLLIALVYLMALSPDTLPKSRKRDAWRGEAK
jgi:hypothetical protein